MKLNDMMKQLAIIADDIELPFDVPNKWMRLDLALHMVMFEGTARAIIHEATWQRDLIKRGIDRKMPDFNKDDFETEHGISVSPLADRVKKTLKTSLSHIPQKTRDRYFTAVTEMIDAAIEMSGELYDSDVASEGWAHEDGRCASCGEDLIVKEQKCCHECGHQLPGPPIPLKDLGPVEPSPPSEERVRPYQHQHE